MNPYQAFDKCWNERKRIVELEGIISTEPIYSYYYALNIIRGPFEKGENSISKHPEWSYKYANYVIQGPFEKSHNVIFNSVYKNEYIKFLKSINCDYCEWLL